jgi:hypothetical protein
LSARERWALTGACNGMRIPDAPRDRKTADLIARALDDALATASLKYLGLSEDDWTEMAEALSRAVAGGLRDEKRLEQTALDALAKRRELLCREVFASSISLDSGAALAGLPPDKRGPKEGEGQSSKSSSALNPVPGARAASRDSMLLSG